jgi:hypothetical protein
MGQVLEDPAFMTVSRCVHSSDVEPGIMPREFANSPGRVLAVRARVWARERV